VLGRPPRHEQLGKALDVGLTVFSHFSEAIFALKPGMEAPKNELQPSFEPAAAPPPPKRVTVTLDLDADLLDWLKEQPTRLGRRKSTTPCAFSWKPA
jgi:hypothetical protein